MKKSVEYYSALLDYHSNAVLAVGADAAAIVFLSKCIPDAKYVIAMNAPHYTGPVSGRIFSFMFRPGASAQWSWNARKRDFFRTNKHLLSSDLLAKSVLAEGKYKAVSLVIREINNARIKIWSGVMFSDIVSAEKLAQARKFIDAGYEESMLFDCPFVAQYADLMKMPVSEAADDIVLMHGFDADLLMKTEILRMKYFKRIAEASSVEQLPALQNDFMLEAYVNAQV